LPPTQTVTQRLDILQPATLYYFRLVVEPGGGTRREGVIKSFETAGNASGGAVSLDGLNDYIYSPNLLSLVSNETFTVEVWFRPFSHGVIIDERGQAPPGSSYQLSLMEILGTGEVRARVNGVGTVSLGTVQFGRWHYAALRYDKPALSLVGFLNGTNSLVATGDRSAPWESGHQWYLGFGLGDSINLGSGAYFRGELDEIRIWSLARTDQDLAISRYRSLKGDENGLLAYWKLDDPAGGNTVVDASGHGNHGTQVNGANRVKSTAPIMTVVPITKRLDGFVVVQFSGVPMQTYIIEESANLVNWQTVRSVQATRTGIIQVEQPTAVERAFFRVVEGQ
jgi:hypothetical protein